MRQGEHDRPARPPGGKPPGSEQKPLRARGENAHRDPAWLPWRIGIGQVEGDAARLRLSFDATSDRQYSDAEVHDYGRDRRFAWRPPVRMTLRARASHPIPSRRGTPTDQPGVTGDAPALLGTAGFGFWNAPFMLAKQMGRLPEAVWFLYTSPPNHLGLVPGMPGWGWRAQVVHAHRWGAVVAGLPTLATVAWARMSGNDAPAARWVQRLSGAHEAMISAPLTEWHAYQLDWTRDAATFFVDGNEILRAPAPPPGPLGFVAWIDNQYAIVTPRGAFKSGIIATGPQWLELAGVEITPLSP